MFSCNKCKLSLNSLEHVENHSVIHTNKEFSVLCKKCDDLVINSLKKLRIHLNKFHVQFDKGFTCKNCQYMTINYDEISRHLVIHLKNNADISCPFCDKVIESVSNYYMHINRKHNENFKKNCDKKFTDKLVEKNMENMDDVEMEIMETETNGDLNESELIINEKLMDSDSHDLLLNLFLKLKSKSVSENVLDLIAEELRRIILVIKRKIINKLETRNANEPNSFTINNVLPDNLLDNFDTKYKRIKLFKECEEYIEPEMIELSSENNKSSYAYVPILKSLAKTLINKKIIKRPLNISSTYTHYSDGSYYKNNEFFSTGDLKIELILFSDDYNLADPLSSAKTKFKTNGVYCKIGNLIDKFDANPIKLVQLCKTKDIEVFGYNQVFRRLVEDLKILQNSGISIKCEGSVKNYLGGLLFFTSDNLGAHAITGLPQNFSNAKYLCRFCYFLSSTLKNKKLEIADRRDKISHQLDVIHNEGGVSNDSVLNELECFHTSDGFPPCVGHDCLQGKLKQDLVNILEIVIKNHKITATFIKNKIKKLSKSVNESFIVINIKNNNISGTMTQVKNTILCLPYLLLGTTVVGTEIHKFSSYVVEITRFILSRTVSESRIDAMKKYIREYMILKEKLFPQKTFTAKDHYIVHYPDFVRIYGPLRFLWTLRFEQFHQNFKYIQYRTKNFKNPMKTLATNFQISQILEEKSCHKFIEPLNVQISDVRIGNFIFITKKIKFFGKFFKINDNILFSFDKNNNCIKLMKVDCIMINRNYDNLLFLGILSTYHYNSNLCMHELHEHIQTEQSQIIGTELLIKRPLYIHRFSEKFFLSLPENLE